MPLYDYECKKCGIQELLLKISEAHPEISCPICNEIAVKNITAPNVRLIGAGFYKPSVSEWS